MQSATLLTENNPRLNDIRKNQSVNCIKFSSLPFAYLSSVAYFWREGTTLRRSESVMAYQVRLRREVFIYSAKISFTQGQKHSAPSKNTIRRQ